jgi:hypothetical protein
MAEPRVKTAALPDREAKRATPAIVATRPEPGFLALQDSFGNAQTQRILNGPLFQASGSAPTFAPQPAPESGLAPVPVTPPETGLQSSPGMLSLLREDEEAQATVVEEVPAYMPEHPLDQPFLRAALSGEAWQGLETAAIRREFWRRQLEGPIDEGNAVAFSSTDELLAPIQLAEPVDVLTLFEGFSGDAEPNPRDEKRAQSWAAEKAMRAFRESVRGLPLTVELDDPDALLGGSSHLTVWCNNVAVSTSDGVVTLAALADCAPRTLKEFADDAVSDVQEIFQARLLDVAGGNAIAAAKNAADLGSHMLKWTKWAELDAHATSCHEIREAAMRAGSLRPGNAVLAPRLGALAHRASAVVERLRDVSQKVRDFNTSEVDRNIWDIIVNQPDEDWERGNYVSSVGGGLLAAGADFLSLGNTGYQVSARNALFKGTISYADYEDLSARTSVYGAAGANLAANLVGAKLAGPSAAALFGIGRASRQEIAAVTRVFFSAFGSAMTYDVYQLALANLTDSAAVRDVALSRLQGPADLMLNALLFVGPEIAMARSRGGATPFKVADDVEPPFTVISDVTDAATKVRTWQLRTVDGQLVTVAAHAETGSGYIWHAGTGEIREIIEGELGGPLRVPGEGPQVTAKRPVPRPKAEELAAADKLKAKSASEEIAEAIEELVEPVSPSKSHTEPSFPAVPEPLESISYQDFFARLREVDISALKKDAKAAARMDARWVDYVNRKMGMHRLFKNKSDYIQFRYGAETEQLAPDLLERFFAGTGKGIGQHGSVAGRVAEKIWGELLVTTPVNKRAYPVTFIDPLSGKTMTVTVVPDFMPTGAVDAAKRSVSARDVGDALVIADSKYTFDANKAVVLDDQIMGMLALAKEKDKPFVFLLKAGGRVAPKVARFANQLGVDWSITTDVSGRIK